MSTFISSHISRSRKWYVGALDLFTNHSTPFFKGITMRLSAVLLQNENIIQIWRPSSPWVIMSPNPRNTWIPWIPWNPWNPKDSIDCMDPMMRYVGYVGYDWLRWVGIPLTHLSHLAGMGQGFADPSQPVISDISDTSHRGIHGIRTFLWIPSIESMDPHGGESVGYDWLRWVGPPLTHLSHLAGMGQGAADPSQPVISDISDISHRWIHEIQTFLWTPWIA